MSAETKTKPEVSSKSYDDSYMGDTPKEIKNQLFLRKNKSKKSYAKNTSGKPITS